MLDGIFEPAPTTVMTGLCTCIVNDPGLYQIHPQSVFMTVFDANYHLNGYFFMTVPDGLRNHISSYKVHPLFP